MWLNISSIDCAFLVFLKINGNRQQYIIEHKLVNKITRTLIHPHYCLYHAGPLSFCQFQTTLILMSLACWNTLIIASVMRDHSHHLLLTSVPSKVNQLCVRMSAIDILWLSSFINILLNKSWQSENVIKRPFHSMSSENVIKRSFHSMSSENVIKRSFHSTSSENVIKRLFHSTSSENVIKRSFHSMSSENIINMLYHSMSSENVIKRS